MEVLRDDNELVFLYQLVKGHSNNSLACHIASIAGLPQQLIERGNEVSFTSPLQAGWVTFCFGQVNLTHKYLYVTWTRNIQARCKNCILLWLNSFYGRLIFSNKAVGNILRVVSMNILKLYNFYMIYKLHKMY